MTTVPSLLPPTSLQKSSHFVIDILIFISILPISAIKPLRVPTQRNHRSPPECGFRIRLLILSTATWTTL